MCYPFKPVTQIPALVQAFVGEIQFKTPIAVQQHILIVANNRARQRVEIRFERVYLLMVTREAKFLLRHF